jgi:hypothetical protein
MLRFVAFALRTGAFQQIKVKKSHRASNLSSAQPYHFQYPGLWPVLGHRTTGSASDLEVPRNHREPNHLNFGRLFRQARATKPFSPPTKPFPAFGVDVPKRGLVIKRITGNGGQRRPDTGDSQMRTLSFLLAFAFMLVGPSIAGSSDGGLPGAGTFTYDGSPIVPSTAKVVLVASR